VLATTRIGVLALLISCSSSDVSRRLGAQCDTRDDCEERCERGGEYPDGFCTTACETDNDCDPSARCVDKEGGICLYGCEATPDCDFLGTGWSCDTEDLRENSDMEVLICIGDD